MPNESFPAREPVLSSQAGTTAAISSSPSASRSRLADAAKVPVTVLIPTLNEAKNLPRCLDHLAWANEVIVLDSNSTDETPRIAEAYGAKLVNFKWNGQWPKKKNWGLRNALMRNEWVLIVDADEWIVPALAAEIADAVLDNRFVGYYINRRFIFMGRWLRHCGYYPSWNLRLLKRGHGEYERLTDVGDTRSGDNEVHEHIVADGPVGFLKSDMLHFAFPDVDTFVEKHNRYANWEAAVQIAGDRKHPIAPNAHGFAGNTDLSWRRRLKQWSRSMPLRPTMRFIYSYVIRLGFLDGRAGYCFCRLLAMYEVLCVVKYYEQRQRPQSQKADAMLTAVTARDWRQQAPPQTMR